VYPALAVYEALKKLKVEKLKVTSSTSQLSNLKPETLNLEALWVGGEGGMEEALVKRAGISYRAIPAAGVHGVGLRALPQNIFKLIRGVIASRKILKEFKPDVLLFTGGYVAAPMALAARNLPTLLYVPDIEPGLALKFLAYFANLITLTADDSQKYFSPNKKMLTTGYPLRPDLENWSRTQALTHFKLDSSKPVLLVTGGSKGARSINNVVIKHLHEILKITQVIHITGELDYETVEKAAKNLPNELKKQYHNMPYLHEMGAALACADVVLSRAGASALGEYPFFGTPAILVPYPYAWRYQKVNAEYLVKQNAAILIKDEDLENDVLTAINDILMNETKRKTMKAAMQQLSKLNAAELIASQLVKLAGVQPL
jgi:UDP-N-acetylglucosamine--N-acetylmuramyl-(pentapeptide) pyrophosphoryl-undecaprenol N-acetylglucosamine transferase